MYINGLDDFDDCSTFLQSSNDVSSWNGKQVELMASLKTSEPDFAKTILGNLQLYSCGKSIKISPLSGNASVSVQKDSDGNTTGNADITISKDNGQVKAEVSVDQDGNVSGKIEASINWDKD